MDSCAASAIAQHGGIEEATDGRAMQGRGVVSSKQRQTYLCGLGTTPSGVSGCQSSLLSVRLELSLYEE